MVEAAPAVRPAIGARSRSILTVSVMHDLAELERERDNWEQLLGRSGGQHPSLTPTWMLTWWRVFGGEGGRRLHALAVRDRRELVGLLPLVARRCRHRGLVPMRRLELLASGEDRADEICSEYLGPIVARGREEEVAAAFAGHLDAERDRWHEIVMPALDGQSRAVSALPAAFRARGLACEERIAGACPFIPLPRRWDDYLAALEPDDRYLVRRSLRDFERWAGERWRVLVATNHEGFAQGKEILKRLHEHRWRSAGREGVFASSPFRQFHDMVMPALLDRGELDLRWLVVDDEPIAASCCVIRDERLYYLQGGRRTDLPKGLRPGIVLHLHAIRAAIEAGRLEYDFLGGAARYKRQLATAARSLVELRITHPSLPEAARGALEASRKAVVEARARLRALGADQQEGSST